MKIVLLFLAIVGIALAYKPAPKPVPEPTPSPKPKMCLHHDRTMHWEHNYGPATGDQKYSGDLILGGEGMAWCPTNNPDNPWGLFILTHSRTKRQGWIYQVNYNDTSDTIQRWSIYYNTSDHVNTSIGYEAKDFDGLTCDWQGNFAIGGRVYLRNLDDNHQVVHKAQAAVFLLDHVTGVDGLDGKQVGGPLPVTGPVTHPTGMTYDDFRDSYWLADRINEIVCEYKVSCCGDRLTDQKIMEDYRRRWVQELHPVQCFGTNYGFYGCKNIYDKRSAKHPHNRAAKYPDPEKPHVEETEEPEECDLRFISTPSFSDPEGLAIDSDGNIWVLNDAPTTNVYKITPHGLLLETYNIEKEVHMSDANGIAVNDHEVCVSFDHWEFKVACFERICNKNRSDLKSNHPGIN